MRLNQNEGSEAMKIKAYLTKPFDPPKEPCSLVVFKNGESIVPPELSELFLTSCGRYAKKFSVHLATGLYLDGASLCMALFAPSGDILGVQRATHINLRWLDEIEPYDDIEVIQTPIGSIFLSVDTDIYHPEVLRLAIFRECDFVVSSQMFPMVDFHEDRIFFGARSAAAANRIYIVHTTPFSSAVLCPPGLTADGSGFLAYPSGREQMVEFDWEDAGISRHALMDDLLSSGCLQHYRNILEK